MTGWKRATGIELDKPFAEAANAIWHKQGLKVIQGDFTKQKAETTYNVILTNPPYVRHHHLLAEEKQRLGELARAATGLKLSGLSGLYCYFLLIAHDWLSRQWPGYLAHSFGVHGRKLRGGCQAVSDRESLLATDPQVLPF